MRPPASTNAFEPYIASAAALVGKIDER